MQFIIRDAAPADATDIAHYNSRMAEETEGRALESELIGPGVAEVLADKSKGRYWVAESEGAIVGQLMVTYEWSDWRNAMFWWIQSVYVPLEHRRKGVFSALYRHVESLAAAEPGVCGLRLYVEHGNERAQQTYEALGMGKTSYLVMESMLGKNP
ncbi:MAG: GNAT family N-acetyltransferase [Woeseiaceae bacterium]